jgi:hypothetical protein
MYPVRGGSSLPKKTCVWNKDYPSLITINSRGKDCSSNGLGDDFSDLWYDDLVQAQAIWASFLIESNMVLISQFLISLTCGFVIEAK